MSSLVIQLVGDDNKREKSVVIPMPEGFEWEEETDTMVDFISGGKVYLVAGLQISATNRDFE